MDLISDKRLKEVLAWVECPPHADMWQDMAAALKELQMLRNERREMREMTVIPEDDDGGNEYFSQRRMR